MTNKWQSRQETYYQLSTQIAYLDNAQVQALFADGDKTEGWGTNHVITLDDTKVFVKSIPVTAVEYQQMFSTKNLYHLPTFYSYGVGSAGFGAFREIAAYIKTTNWVLAGASENFPLMYHYRIMPTTDQQSAMDDERMERYTAYWGGNENIKAYILARQQADYQAVLFLEYFPHTVWPWIEQNLDKLDAANEQMCATITFMRQQGFLHFDAHLGNILTDGDTFYLTDFGLVLDEQFDLSDEERAFVAAHSHYDYGNYLEGLLWPLVAAYRTESEAEQQQIRQLYGIAEGTPDDTLHLALLENYADIYDNGRLTLDPHFAAILSKYHAPVYLATQFYVELRHNPQKDTAFPNEELKHLLEATGFLAEVDEPKPA